MLKKFGAFMVVAWLTACGGRASVPTATSPSVDHAPNAVVPGTPVPVGNETKHSKGVPSARPSVARTLEYDNKISAPKLAVLRQNIADIGRIPLEDSAALKALLGTDDLEASTLKNWFTDRVQYLVDDSHPFNLSVGVGFEDLGETLRYPEATHLNFPQSISFLNSSPASASGGAAAQGGFIATNLGFELYAQSKGQIIFDDEGYPTGRVYGFEFNGRIVRVDSPRVGIIQIGALFYASPAQETQATHLVRISTLLHEAHHGDGHGISLGFAHVNCPRGHQYAGLAACDIAANGTYALESAFLKAAAPKCAKCTAKDLEVIRFNYLDYSNRLVKINVGDKDFAAVAAHREALVSQPPSHADAATQTKIQMSLEIYDYLSEFLRDLQRDPNPTWDPTPETLD